MIRNGWRLALILLSAVILLGIIASTGRADPVYVHGIVQDDAYQPVSGGTIGLSRYFESRWIKAIPDAVMESHAFGWDIEHGGQYRVFWALDGYEIIWIKGGLFTIPGAPTGDIVVNVKRIPVATATPTSFPVPTTLMPPTVDPTRTATPEPRPTLTPNPAVSYITITAHTQGTIMAFQAVAMQEYVPASCFEIAATQEGCPLSVTQAWVGKVGSECWKFQPFSCPGGDGIEVAARCESPCEVAIITNGYW